MSPCMIVWVPISYFEDEEDLFENARFYRADDGEDNYQDKIKLFEMIDDEFVNEYINQSNK
ncbi:hypothetical protein PL321_02505 [Caloramator sp. mosi_1]|uniref:hypothetical protein n=1 Tax=Caloramator sp. mosi_1 TaxID=3023090 RepID=UPI002361C9DA|nr:hypothetical protein [Caloramator sp. mosi_1]WDC84601.1 hypothetical protein PL321_02505 [Caloramator sp. mosi_1]